jgi:hypothetical protein
LVAAEAASDDATLVAFPEQPDTVIRGRSTTLLEKGGDDTRVGRTLRATSLIPQMI